MCYCWCIDIDVDTAIAIVADTTINIDIDAAIGFAVATRIATAFAAATLQPRRHARHTQHPHLTLPMTSIRRLYYPTHPAQAEGAVRYQGSLAPRQRVPPLPPIPWAPEDENGVS